MKLTFADIPQLKAWIAERKNQLEELKNAEPTPDNLKKVRKIETEAKDLQRKIKALKGNMYPYA